MISPETTFRHVVFLSGVGGTGKTTFLKKLVEGTPNVHVWNRGDEVKTSKDSILVIPSQTRKYYKTLQSLYQEELSEKYINSLPLDQQIRFQYQLYSFYLKDLLHFLEMFAYSLPDYRIMILERSPYDHISYIHSRVLQICRETRQALPSAYEQNFAAEIAEVSALLSPDWAIKRNLKFKLAYTPYPPPWAPASSESDEHGEDGFRDTSSKKNKEWNNALLKCRQHFLGEVIHLDVTKESSIQEILS